MKRLLIWLTCFSIGMGYLESAVVVYLRELYYPEGFHFPFKMLSNRIFITELLREAATIIMLVSIAWIAGKNWYQRFACFLFCFGIWDIVYYLGLKMLLGWPDSLFTWDILFLIPVVWVGPVLAPVICSLSMIGFAFSILYFESKGKTVKFHPKEWLLLITGSTLILITFVWDYSLLVIQNDLLNGLSNNERLIKALGNYLPQHYHWWLFIAGEITILSGFLLYYRRNRLKK